MRAFSVSGESGYGLSYRKTTRFPAAHCKKAGDMQLLRCLCQLWGGFEHIFADMVFKLAEIVAEHTDELARLRVIGRLVRPGFARVEDFGIHARHSHRHAEAEMWIDPHLG